MQPYNQHNMRCCKKGKEEKIKIEKSPEVIEAKKLSEEQPEDDLIDLPEDAEVWT